MPFPCHDRVVTPFLEQLGHRHHLLVEITFMSRLTSMRRGTSSEFGQLTQAGDVVICSRHQHRPRGRTCRGDVKGCEPQPCGLGGKSIDVGRLNLRTEATTVTEAQVIGHDDEEVGPSSLLCGGSSLLPPFESCWLFLGCASQPCEGQIVWLFTPKKCLQFDYTLREVFLFLLVSLLGKGTAMYLMGWKTI